MGNAWFPDIGKGASIKGTFYRSCVGTPATLMIGRARKTLNWMTPTDALEQEILEFRPRGALDS
ncbi:hypothetical protein JWH11_04155 [Xanthomonas melonis]|uniref:Uncharacterized protein n=1 Tax=Xanthomonas melonis TaxID=56456 RepID=A0ABS8NT76_9XANT|nr:hypothetical protein [Xanthomonas melonis]MCD0257419.1 hypothetical protein [Xanthomonas melonis]MCD0265639.1 hypothetical protein [Xanthomonas melonis]MCD0277880.1 hypothetical protein [Xanthomonas melonis]